jgi:hypothetical protein
VLPFEALQEQRSEKFGPLDPDVVTANAPSLIDQKRIRIDGRWVIACAVLLVVALIGFGLADFGSKHKVDSSATSLPPQPSRAVSLAANCPVRSTIAFTTVLDAAGDFKVIATGTVTDAAAKVLTDTKISWVVVYKDLSTGNPTTTSVGTLKTGESSSWSSASSSNDGPVPPSKVRVLHFWFDHGTSTC